MLLGPKFLKYEDVQQKLILRKDIPDITPYPVTLPDPPKPENIINYGLPIEEQFFKREIIPSWVWKLTERAQKPGKPGRQARSEVIKLAENNKEYSKFIGDQWEKRERGIWIYIRGKPIWVPGKQWHYCNYYYMDDGLPNYWYVDTEYYYWWDLCIENNPSVYGGIEMTMRRDGKSYRGGNTCLYNTTQSRAYEAGLQSKTNEDSRDLFMRTIVLPWRRLPFYFSPKYDNTTYPSKEINFRDPESELYYDDDNPLEELVSDELNSKIEARSTVTTAFDGRKLQFYFLDEAGKTEEMLVSQAWRVHKQCLRKRDVIIGKALITSTVEETTKGGLEEFKKIWLDSDHHPDQMTRLGQTKSGLLRYFKPSFETYAIDQYGFSIIDNPLPYQAEYRKKNGNVNWMMGGKELIELEIEDVTDPAERQKQIRMYPRTVKEALRPGTKNCEFDEDAIRNRLDDFLYKNDEVVTGNLEWKDGVRDSEVIFVECSNGRWKIKKGLLQYLIGISNNIPKGADNKPYPGNKHMGCLGADPYKYNATNQERRSLGTCSGYMNYNPEVDANNDEDNMLSDDYFFHYAWRHEDKKRYGEDVILSCHFFGMEVFPEINVASLWDYLVDRGYEHFLKYKNIIKRKKRGHGVKIEKSNTPGMTTLGDTMKEPIFSLLGTYWKTNGRRCVFVDFMQDCLDVEYSDWSPYDHFVSGAYAIYGAKGIARPIKDAPKAQSFDGFWQPKRY